MYISLVLIIWFIYHSNIYIIENIITIYNYIYFIEKKKHVMEAKNLVILSEELQSKAARKKLQKKRLQKIQAIIFRNTV